MDEEKTQKKKLSPLIKLPIFILSLTLWIIVVILFTETNGPTVFFSLLIPIVAGALLYGKWGGILMGVLGSLIHLGLIYVLFGRDMSRSSPFVIVISSTILGTGLGLAHHYLEKTREEITVRKQREKELQDALEEKELLLRELNHRVKNNLNLIKSLIQLQIYRTENKTFKEEAEKLIGRIFSISLLHEQLYSHRKGDYIDLKSYLERLILNMIPQEIDNPLTKATHITLVSTPLILDRAILIGLIVNEVLTNSIKYAFLPPFSGRPSINLTTQVDRGTLHLSLEDNGVGLNADDKGGLGMTLITSLTAQLGGISGFEKAAEGPLPGTLFTLTAPLE